VIAVLAAAALLGPPVVVHDAQERSPLASVGARPGAFATAPVVYRRVADGWVQFWLLYVRNDQDRGLLRTGRHAGDCEMVQVRADGSEAVFAQHAGAERCPASAARVPGRAVRRYVANGSHASYFVPGVRDRMWPDPNDEARGDGAVVVPRVEPVGAWARWPGRWGGARAGWVPGETDSPRGPAFQPDGRWSDPEGWARRARPCTLKRCDEVGECDARETLAVAALPAAAVLIVVGLRRRRRTSSRAGPPRERSSPSGHPPEAGAPGPRSSRDAEHPGA
jgi:hypothetical protein